jgi:DNA-binding CsgD family transcriptional regulator
MKATWMLRKRQPPGAEDIVAALYEAALAPAAWEAALVKLGAWSGADGAILYRAQAPGADGALLAGIPNSPDLRLRFVQEVQVSPFVPKLAAAPLYMPQADRDLIPRAELERTAFFRDWIEPFDMTDGLLTALAPIGPEAATLTLIRRGGGRNAFGEQAIRRLNRLMPHLRRALQVQRELMARNTLPASVSAFLLDTIAIPALILNHQGRVAWGNAAGMDITRSNGCVTLARDGRLEAYTPQAQRALAGLLASAFGDEGGGCVRLDRPTGLPLVILAVPLDSASLMASGQSVQGMVTLLFLDGAAQVPSAEAAERFQRLFRLTPAELAVAVMVAEEKSVPQVAAALGIAPSTVRTHVKSLFFKTDTRSQGGLSRLVRQLDLIRDQNWKSARVGPGIARRAG